MSFMFKKEDKGIFIFKCEEINHSFISVNCCFIHLHITKVKVKVKLNILSCIPL